MFYRVFFFIIGLTCKKKEFGIEHVTKLKKANKNCIFCSWHNNASTGVWVLKNQNIAIMASESHDGEMIARVAHSLGNTTIRGSTSKGSVKVFIKMLKWLRKGNSAGITPDGPQGPKYRLQSGTISLAQKSGYPLIPIHIEATKQWVFNDSWDKHKLPKPFSTIVIEYGAPFRVPQKMTKSEFDAKRQQFEKLMIDETKRVKDEVNLLASK